MYLAWAEELKFHGESMERRRGLVVGAGSMGRAWVKNLLECPEVEFTGWVDLDQGVIQISEKELGIQAPYKGVDLGAALETVKPDFVVDVSTPESHCQVTLQSLRAGVPVLGEKPMASSMDEARRMVFSSRETGKLYMVSQSRRYDPRIEAFKRAVGELGPLGILNADFYLGPHFGGFRDQMNNVLLLDMAIHTFDQARFLSGADPKSVYCEEYNPDWSWYRGASSANALFEMSNGLRFAYRGSWCAEGRNTSWEAEWRAVGPKGSATWDGDRSVQSELVKTTEGFMSEMESTQETIEDATHTGIAGSLRDFLKALDDPAHVPMGRCDDNIKSLAMVFAAIESARTGIRIPIETT